MKEAGIKLPEYVKSQLKRASDYSKKSRSCIEEFEKWVNKNIGEDFDFSFLSACGTIGGFSTEALSHIEYGVFEERYIKEIEDILTLYKSLDENERLLF